MNTNISVISISFLARIKKLFSLSKSKSVLAMSCAATFWKLCSYYRVLYEI